MPDFRRASGFPCDVVIVGGCGRAGLPLAVALADAGARVVIYDVSEPAVAAVSAARLPFAEPGAARPLERAVATGHLAASADPRIVRSAEHVILAIPEPVSGRAAGPPRPSRGRHAAVSGETTAAGPAGGGPALRRAVSDCAGNLRDGQIVILRGAAGPGVTAWLEKVVADLGVDVDVAFCPERHEPGQALAELRGGPQIVSSRTERGLERAARLFARLTPAQVPMMPEEAELATLFASAWRYVGQAAANQLYMVASDRGLDFGRIRRGVVLGFPRAAGLPPAGLAAGRHLLPDTMRLAAAGASFPLGQAALEVNEGLPGYLLGRLDQRYDLGSLTVGILGMADAAAGGEARDSLSYRLLRLLAGRAAAVLGTDPLIDDDPALLPLDEVLARADLLIIGAPHHEYRGLATRKPILDVSNLLARGVLA